MSANRLRPQGSGNSRASQAQRLQAATTGVVAMSSSPGHHSATFWPGNTTTTTSSFHNTLSELQVPNNDNNNANHLALERHQHQHQQLTPRPAWSGLQGVVPNAASFTSLQELYGQELNRSMPGGPGPAAASHVKAESTLMDQQQHNNNNNSFLQCRGSDQLDLNYGWERYISS